MTYPVDTTAEPAKKPGPGLALSIITIIVGTAIGIAGLAVAITKIVDGVRGPIHTAPATLTQHLSSGSYNVYAAVVGRDDTTPLGGSGTTSFIVTAPGGGKVALTIPSSSEFLGRSGTEYYAFYTFKAPVSGDYTIQANGKGREPFYVAHTFGDAAKSSAGWFVMMGAGILIGIVGVVLLIVGIVRRRRAKRPAFVGGYQPAGYPGGYGGGYQGGYQPVQPTLPPAGWYPDPQVPGTNRYWDGARWTDQTQTPETS